MRYFIYILYSHKDSNLYVGCTSDLEKRFTRHTKGYVSATKHRRPLVLIHSEDFESKSDAFQRERFLKTLWGARFKQKVKQNYLKNSRG